jgi:hypothetical protein
MPVTINGTSGVVSPDGSAGTPAYQGSDANTGMFFPAADTIAFAEGGTEVMRIDSSGNVGIGTSSPSYRLDVVASGGTTISGVYDTNSGGNSQAIARLRTAGTGAGYWDIGTGNNSSGLNGALRFFDNIAAAERARIDSSGNMMWNGTNTTTSNGNAGYIYKFFGAANNVIIPLESSGSNKFGIFEYRRTGRTSARTSQISIGENASSQGEVQVYSSAANADLSGGVVLANGATSWSAISDMRLKTVTGMYTNALQDLAKIQAIKFTWKHDQSNTPQVGVSAQSVELAVPEAISTSRNISTPDDETDYLSVRYTELIPLMIASIQEQQALITSLTARIAALEGAAQ